MENLPEKLSITSEYLTKLSDYHSRNTVGKLLKRVEICENKEAIKNHIREVIYEAYRDFVHLLVAFNDGFEMTYFKFISKEK